MTNGQPPGPGQSSYPQSPPGYPAPGTGGAPPQGQEPRPHAHAPQGSLAAPASSEVLFEGIARHSANLGAYLKWSAACVLGAGAAYGLNSLDEIATTSWGVYLWALSGLGLPGLAVAWLVHVNRKYKVTRRRVETEIGVLSKSVDTLELWRVLDIQYTQSLLDRVFGNAKISLIGTDQSSPVLVLHGLPNHRKLFEELREAIQLARHSSRPMELVPGQDLHSGTSEFVG